jgi:chemotaxis signal transduction protein
MVDLVKIRRKAKEKRDAEELQGATSLDEASPADHTEEVETKARGKAATRKSKASPDKNATSAEAAEPKQSDVTTKSEPPPEKPPASGKAKADKAVAASRPSESVVAEAEATEESAGARSGVVAEDDVAPDDETLDRLEKFKREAGKRRSWALETTRSSVVATEEVESGDLELLRFRLAGEEYAVDIEKIVEIVPPRGTTRVPNADPTIVGIMSLRGTIVTVFDLRRKLGHPPIEKRQELDRRMIVVERQGETAGFLVDKVSRVVKLDPDELENHPVVSAAEQSDYVGGVFQAADGLVILLDLEKILASQS